VILTIEGQQSKRQVLLRQARVVVFKVSGHSKQETEKSRPVHDVAECQERTADACVELRTVNASDKRMCEFRITS
jgi:hypothetical protein